MANPTILPAAEFQALPLEFIIAAPLAGAVKAQSVAAENTKNFIAAFKDAKVKLSTSVFQPGGDKRVEVEVPLLSLVPVPHLRIDSLTVNFKYEISQIVADKNAVDKGLDFTVGTTGFLSNFVNATIKGAVSSKSSSESTLNRSGSMEITMHASEGEIPEGLARVLSLLAREVPEAPKPGATSVEVPPSQPILPGPTAVAKPGD